jgi:serine/threonine protein kinase
VEGIADYEFVRLLDEANYGDLYLARTPARLPVEAQHVVVKVVPGTADDATFRRATRELKHFSLVRSDKLVTIYDAGRQAGTFFYTMEYLELGTLEEPARPLSREEVLIAVADAAEAVHALHENGVAHRDVKPANVLLHEGGAKLSDLGLSQLLTPGMVFTGMGQLGLEYTDPAILVGGEASRATDIWSLGATLHKALTGESVYGTLPTSEPLLLVRAILAADVAPHSSLEPAVAQIVSDCTAKDVAHRPGTAADVASALRALV